MREFELFHPGEDGWCEWVHPAPGPTGAFMMKCCDCGLVHDVQFEVVENVEAHEHLSWPGEGDVYVIWRMRRNEVDEGDEG